MHLGVPATKASDVRLKARRIEPAKHLVELFAQNEPNHWHGKFPKLHWLAKDTTENLRSLGVSQLASCNLQFQQEGQNVSYYGESSISGDYRLQMLLLSASVPGCGQLEPIL